MFGIAVQFLGICVPVSSPFACGQSWASPNTGDRPYKCQHCGDQFARSDLLSRHVNKCHAGEKPLNSNGNTRRKGSASATRATTSKQACDQCVQSSLPCDGCNPCGALGGIAGMNGLGANGLGAGMINPGLVPIGGLTNNLGGLGGLNGPALTSIGALGNLPLLPSGTSPSALAAGTGVGPRNSNGVPLYQQNASAAAAAAASETGTSGTGEDFLAAATAAGQPPSANGDIFTPSRFSFPSVYGASGGLVDDYANKYRAQQAELMRRGSIGHGYSSHHEQQRPHSSHATASSTNWSLPSVNGWTTEPESYHQRYHPVYGHALHRERRMSGDFSDASVSGSGESGSMPSSATSSNVHLPLDNSSYGRHSGSPPNPNSTDPSGGSRPGTSHGEGGFHNAFGLMSLEDPAVLAGIQTDGTPFFSMMDQLGPEGMQNFNSILDHSDPNATPMPDKLQQMHAAHAAVQQQQQQQQQGQQGGYHARPSTGHGYPSMSAAYGMVTPGSREQETKELKDFWKAYMRTPLSGPGGGILAPTSPRDKKDGDVHMLSPGLHGPPSGYRRQRVSSLPSVKTPTPLDEAGTTGYYGGYAPEPGGKAYGGNTSRSHPGTSQVLPPGSGAPDLGGTLHNMEDLRSYEAAVLARKAPTNLNLVPRTRKSKATSPSDNTSPPPPAAASSFTGTVFQSQSPSASSSFSRESSSSLDDANNSDGPMRRPSFKRLASQQLESQHVKRALLNRDRDVIGEFEYEDSGSSGPNSRPMSTHNLDVGDNKEALADDEDDFADSDRHRSKRRLFVPTSLSESGSQPGSASASPVVGAPSNAFLSGMGASPTMMYGSVPKNAQNLMQQALMGGASSVEMGMAEKRRRMSAPTSKSPTSATFLEAGQL
ncbi:hypothetical protein VKT23_013918 [Stygiomarasmius scandens]|uniref:C2H2-type domain-containing protein n=1 Tax=Marasmiellus scandens TaxID=2682957 RepID=A0ABR1J1H8_9AGAR